LKYDIYRNTWPLLAFATYKKIQGNVPQKSDVNGHEFPTVQPTFTKTATLE
jgi:hypothetical protein